MSPPVIIDACRTPVGRRHGGLSGWHPADLAGAVLDALARRSGLDPAAVDEVVMGCSTTVGDQGCNLARSAVLAAGWPESVPATTVDRQGASSLQAVAVAASAVAAGSCDVVVAAGVECSTTTPAGSWVEPGARPFGPAVTSRYAGDGGLVPPGMAAEALAGRYGLRREELDGWASRSRRQALRARRAGCLDAQLVTVAGRSWDRERRLVVELDVDVAEDEGVEEFGEDPASFPPMFVPGGMVTAANRATAGDAAAAVLVMSERRAEELGRRPLARVVGAAGGGVSPLEHLGAVVPATAAVLRRAGAGMGDVTRFEVDESFAAVPLAWMAELGADPVLVNADGGAIARGDPAGAAGAILVTSLGHGLARSGGGLGLATLSGIGGVATAILVASP